MRLEDAPITKYALCKISAVNKMRKAHDIFLGPSAVCKTGPKIEPSRMPGSVKSHK